LGSHSNNSAAAFCLTRGAILGSSQSLLNSRRMYRKLLEALAEMGKQGETANASPLVGELDLFVTATDIEGVPLPMSLKDNVIYERRYKNVFHFRYAPDLQSETDATANLSRDDFKKSDDPFLAFAARCTSSFPFAFEAMRLADIEDILDHYERYVDDDPTAEKPDWDQFFKDYLQLGLYDIDKDARQNSGSRGLPKDAATMDKAQARLRKRFRTRSFGDGGYLDNKPFSHATSLLMRRRPDSMVLRKLLYIEPTPQHPEFAPPRRDAPDFAENVSAAVLDLPRQENIREDLERLDERNEMLERISMFAAYADADLTMAKNKPPLKREQFVAADLEEMIEHYGVSYGAYHRLNVEEVTNLLADLIARALGHDPSSKAAEAIREITIAWRLLNYDEQKLKDVEIFGLLKQRPTENAFLVEFDVRYRLRRLVFLIRRVTELTKEPYTDHQNIRGLLDAWLDRERVMENKPPDPGRSSPRLKWMPKEWFKDDSLVQPDENWLKELRAELKHIKRATLGPGVIAARIAEEQFGKSTTAAAEKLTKAIKKLDLPWDQLEKVLAEDIVEKNNALDAVINETRRKAFENVANVFRTEWSNRAFTELHIADVNVDIDLTNGAVAARRCLHHYYRNFNVYDLITFPVQYGSNSGEANVVDVYRVSPQDAKSLMQETADPLGPTKLAGRALMSFGAFLDEAWRRNDMLWGRLDAAERLINILLPGKENCRTRQQLIREAHHGIINQEINEGNADAACRLLSHALSNSKQTEPCGRELAGFVREVASRNTGGLNDAQKTMLATPQNFERQLPSRRALEYISRSTNITGDMLSGLSDKYQFQPGKRVSGWIARLGIVLWHLIAVAIPQSLASLFFRHWLGLVYFIAFGLIITGVLLNNDVKFAGWELLGIVVAVHLVVTTLSAYIRGRRFMALARAVAGLILIAFMVLGGFHVLELIRGQRLDQTTELLLVAAVAFGIVVLAGIAAAVRLVIDHLATISGVVRQMLAELRTRARADSRVK
jgi:patatin-related protein